PLSAIERQQVRVADREPVRGVKCAQPAQARGGVPLEARWIVGVCPGESGFRTGVNRLAEGIGGAEAQAVREPLGRLDGQCVIVAPTEVAQVGYALGGGGLAPSIPRAAVG